MHIREQVIRIRRAQRVGALLILACALLLARCSAPLEAVCTDELRAVIEVDILDSASRAPAASGATLWLRGPYSDSLTVPNGSTSPVAKVWFEDRVKAGTYAVEIKKVGYRDWSQSGLRIQADRCHTTTFDHITALLQR